MMTLFLLFVLCGFVAADITGTDPPQGTCLCFYFTNVNVRATQLETTKLISGRDSSVRGDGGGRGCEVRADATYTIPKHKACKNCWHSKACGTVLGMSQPGECYRYQGSKTTCDLSGTSYEFFALDWRGGQTGHTAGEFVQVASSDSMCDEISVDQGVCDEATIVSRAEWGARSPAWSIPGLSVKPVGMTFIHHTVTGHCYDQAACSTIMRSVQNYHMDSNGWPDIAYNYLVGEDGRVYEGRGWDKEGAHTCGYNHNAVAVCVMGNFEANPKPNDAALKAVRDIIDCGVRQNIIQPWGQYELFGHRDGGATACPGINLYNEIRSWPWYSFRTIPRPCGYNQLEVEHVPHNG